MDNLFDVCDTKVFTDMDNVCDDCQKSNRQQSAIPTICIGDLDKGIAVCGCGQVFVYDMQYDDHNTPDMVISHKGMLCDMIASLTDKKSAKDKLLSYIGNDTSRIMVVDQDIIKKDLLGKLISGDLDLVFTNDAIYLTDPIIRRIERIKYDDIDMGSIARSMDSLKHKTDIVTWINQWLDDMPKVDVLIDISDDID